MNPTISIMVDYAHEPHSMTKLLDMLVDFRRRQIFDKIIHIVSCDGAGRDDWKKPVMGQISYTRADFTVVTTESYDQGENPTEIVQLITENFGMESKIDSPIEFKSASKYLEQINRDQAMQQSLEIAVKMQDLYNLYQKNDNQEPESLKILIVSTGVGSEQKLWINGQDVIRDESQVWAKLWKELELKLS